MSAVTACLLEADWRPLGERQRAELFARYAGLGFDAVTSEAEDYPPDFVPAARKAGLRVCAALAMFSDHAHGNRVLMEHPELWPIDEHGRRREQLEWYVGVVPSVEWYAEQRIARAESLLQRHGFDAIYLDFIRWPLHWEIECRPGAERPARTSFDAITLGRFAESADLDLPTYDPVAAASWILAEAHAEWRSFRCEVITSVVAECAQRLRAIRPDCVIGLSAPPLEPAQLEDLVGQNLRALGAHVDEIACMVYHAILHRDPAWAAQVVEAQRAGTAAVVVPVLQAESARGAELGADWGPEVDADDWSGLLAAVDLEGGFSVFPASAILADPRKRVVVQR